jgi:hypothetical protein
LSRARPFNASRSRIVKKKINLPAIPQSAFARLRGFPEHLRELPPASNAAGLRGFYYVHFHAGVLLFNPGNLLAPDSDSRHVQLCTVFGIVQILRGMEERNALSTFFGIFVLKRFSSLRKRLLPLNRAN